MLGAHASFAVAIITAASAALSVFGVVQLAEPSAFFDAMLAGVLGFMIRRMSRAAAVSALAIFIAERLYAGLEHGMNAAVGVLAVILLLGFIVGVRGTFAYHRFSPKFNAKV